VLLAISLFSSPTGLIKYRKMKAEHDRISAANRALSLRNEELSAEVKALREDPSYIEKVARDRIGMVKENEVIFKLRK
jgi:cell division protein FtsB